MKPGDYSSLSRAAFRAWNHLSTSAQEEPYRAFKNDRKEYEARVKQQVAHLRG